MKILQNGAVRFEHSSRHVHMLCLYLSLIFHHRNINFPFYINDTLVYVSIDFRKTFSGEDKHRKSLKNEKLEIKKQENIYLL